MPTAPPTPTDYSTGQYVARLTKPLVTGTDDEYRWVRSDWPYAEIPLGPGGGSAFITWAVNTPGQLKIAVDRWLFSEVYSAVDWDPGGSGVTYIVPESTTLWLFRNGSPIWAGFLRDIDGDTTSPDITLTAEEFTGSWTDLMLTDDWAVTAADIDTTLDEALARELRAPWMVAHYHAALTGSITATWSRSETRRLKEIIDELALSGDGFEWQQYLAEIGTGAWEAQVSVHPVKAGFDYQELTGTTFDIGWGSGTVETATTARYNFSTRGTRTRAVVVGAAGEMAIRDYNEPLGVPRRDLVVNNSTLQSALVIPTAVALVKRNGLPQLTATVTLQVGDFAGGWPFLWLTGTGSDPGCSPVGSRFQVTITDAGQTYDAILRVTTWGIAIDPGAEYLVLDLVQDELAAEGLLLEIQTVV